jgi:ELWxxDGT repeat protein
MRLADEIVVQAGVSQISVDDLLKRISAFAKQATSEGKVTREMLPETVLSDLEESLSVAKRVSDSGILDANGNVSQDSNFSSIDTEIPTFSRSYIIGRSSQDENAIKEINLPEVSRNKGREIIVETDMNLLIHAQDNQIEHSKDMLLLSATAQAANRGLTLVSDGKQWKTIGAYYQRNDSSKKFYNRHSKVAVIDINKGKGDSDPSNFTLFKESVYFEASTVEHGSELWVTDGTKEGTRMIKDIVPGAQGSSPKDFYVLEGI